MHVWEWLDVDLLCPSMQGEHSFLSSRLSHTAILRAFNRVIRPAPFESPECAVNHIFSWMDGDD
jgi:hypothetical protein